MRSLGSGLILLALAGCADPGAPLEPVAPLPDAVSADLAASFAADPSVRVRLLVLPDPGVDLAGRLDRSGGRLVRSFRHVRVAVAELTEAEARALVASGGVRLAADRPITASGRGGKASASLVFEPDAIRGAIGADRVHAGDGVPAVDGTGVVVALIDSGVRQNHPDFPTGFVVDAADFVDADGDGAPDRDDAAALRDGYGHGTMVAGVLVGQRDGLRGVAPGVRVVAARVLDDDGAGHTSGAIAAVDWVVEHADETGVRIVHFSIGAAPYESFTTDPLARAVETALDAGLVVVAAAGNYGQSDGAEAFGGILSPANHPGAITVGAVDGAGSTRRSDDAIAAFSSRGPTLFDGLGKPDLVAPGVHLPLAARSGSTLWTSYPSSHLGVLAGVPLDGAPYAVASGTSFSAPMVTGAVALVLDAAPGLTSTQVKAVLELSASSLAGDPLAVGVGELNALGSVRLAAYLDDPSRGRPDPMDTIAGERVDWGLALLWDGFARADEPLWAPDDVLAYGDMDGSGILWDGWGVRYVGVRAMGEPLLEPTSFDALADTTWGSGILWDGELKFGSSRVWTSSAWRGALVWPDHLTAQGVASPLFAEPDFVGLTDPVRGAADPSPFPPDFGDDDR